MRDIHYGPSPVDAEDQSYFNVFFTDKAPVRPTKEMQLGTLGISEIIPRLVIPPNVVKTFTTKTVIQEDISLLTINPTWHIRRSTGSDQCSILNAQFCYENEPDRRSVPPACGTFHPCGWTLFIEISSEREAGKRVRATSDEH